MTISQVPHTPTQFEVESSSLECPICKNPDHSPKLFSRKETRFKNLTNCPTCGSVLNTRKHLVDLAHYIPIGECACEHFQRRLKKEVEKLSPAALAVLTLGEIDRLQCSHIRAAEKFAIRLTVVQHEHLRYKDAKGQREGIGA